MSDFQLLYSNTSSNEMFFKELMTRNIGLILKSCGFDGVESRFLLNYLTDLQLKIIEGFIKELGQIINENKNDGEDKLFLTELRYLLNKFNIICDDNYNVDETVLQIKDSTNNKNTSIIEQEATQGIEYFQKWVEENTVYNFDFRNLTKQLRIKNLKVFNSSTLNSDVDVNKISNNTADKALGDSGEHESSNVPSNLDPNQNLDWITFNFLNNLNDRTKVISALTKEIPASLEEEENHDKENASNEKNDILDTILAPEILRPLSFAKKRKIDFLNDDSDDVASNNQALSMPIEEKTNETQSKVISHLNLLRNRKQFMLSFEQGKTEKDDENKVDELLEELNDIKMPELPITDDIDIDLNWLGQSNEF